MARSTSTAALALTAWLLAVASSSAATELVAAYSPYTPEGARLVKVRALRFADSCSMSYVSGQRGPLRCFSGNRILDPCFPNPLGEDEALCVSSPRSRTGVMLRGALSADDGSGGTPNRNPWAIELFDGGMCVFASGATNARRGLRLNYICDGGRFLWGSPYRRRSTWTIRKSTNSSGRGWRRVKIRTAWR